MRLPSSAPMPAACSLQQQPVAAFRTVLPTRCQCQLTGVPRDAFRIRRSASPLFGHTRVPSRPGLDRLKLVEAAAAESSSLSPDQGGDDFSAAFEAVDQQDQLEVFPRRRERDAYRLLGVPRDASFEEVEDAKTFLLQRFRWHAASRESIELAYDRLLQEHLKRRHRHGFKPPKTGRRTDVEGDANRVSLLARIKEQLDPSVNRATLVNDGSIFVALAVWTAFQAAVDPTLPLGSAIAFCAWRLFDKRKKRNPDGPFVGGSPIWGALATTLVGLVVGGMVSYAVATYLPLPPRLNPPALMLFLMSIFLGATCIFLR